MGDTCEGLGKLFLYFACNISTKQKLFQQQKEILGNPPSQIM